MTKIDGKARRAPRPPIAPPPAPTLQRKAVIHWRETENQTLQNASRIAGVSVASLYRAQDDGRLTFKRLCGRVVVPTASLTKFVDGADEWVSSGRGGEARSARSPLV